MKVAIMGCGPGGAYLYALLRRKMPGVEISLFDKGHHTVCGIKPCAWAVSRSPFMSLCKEIDIIPPILGQYDHVNIGGMRVKADVATIDKPAFIRKLVEGANISDGAPVHTFERIIDATGKRTYLSAGAERRVKTAQRKIKARLDAPLMNLRRDGWAWAIPLGEYTHIGAGSVRTDPRTRIDDLGLEGCEVLCQCQGDVSCGGFIEPFVQGNVWGLGESIGLVDPMTGEGIVPAMLSAKLMLDNWDNPLAYEESVKKTFSVMQKEAHFVKRLISGKMPFTLFVKTFTAVYPTFFQRALIGMKISTR